MGEGFENDAGVVVVAGLVEVAPENERGLAGLGRGGEIRDEGACRGNCVLGIARNIIEAEFGGVKGGH